MIIDFKITGMCNEKCPFCWDACKGMKNSNIDDILISFEKLRGIVDIVTVTGGEPLIVNGIEIVLKSLFEMGFKVYLSTNGLLLNNYLTTVTKFVSILGLPIDSIDPMIQRDMGRSDRLPSVNLSNLIAIKKMNPEIITKVGTVASRINLQYIPDIGRNIFKLPNVVDYWSVYQFASHGMGYLNRDKYCLLDNEYDELCNRLKKDFKDRVHFLRRTEVTESYWFILPDLTIARYSEYGYTCLGDLRTLNRTDLYSMLSESIQKPSLLNHREKKLVT